MELARVGRIKEKGRGRGRHIQQGQVMVRSGRMGDTLGGSGEQRPGLIISWRDFSLWQNTRSFWTASWPGTRLESQQTEHRVVKLGTWQAVKTENTRATAGRARAELVYRVGEGPGNKKNLISLSGVPLKTRGRGSCD